MFSLKLSVSLCTLREETDDSVVEEASVKKTMHGTGLIRRLGAEISDRSRARTRAF